MYALLCQDKNGETKAVMYEERCPSYKESNKGNKQRQGPALGVRFTEVSVKRESTVLVICVGVRHVPKSRAVRSLGIFSWEMKGFGFLFVLVKISLSTFFPLELL